jgi:hypothetical protein
MRLLKPANIVILCMITAFLCDAVLGSGRNKGEDNSAFDVRTIPQKLIEKAMYIAQAPVLRNHGFIKIPEAAVPSGASVLVLAPANCTSQTRQRATEMGKFLTENSVPYRETDQISLRFPPDTDPLLTRRITVALSGDVPVVIVNGWIKANPAQNEVLSLYHSGK